MLPGIIYKINLFADGKTISKKFTMGTWERYQVCLDESRMIYSTKDFERIINVTSEYTEHIAKFYSLKNGDIVDSKNATPLEREKTRDFNPVARNTWLYSFTGGRHPRTVIIARDNYRPLITEKLMTKYCHISTKTDFLRKYFNFVKKARVMNSGWYRKIMYVYEKKRLQRPVDDVLPQDIYLPAAHTTGMGHHITFLEFWFPNSGDLQNLISPKDNLLNETTLELDVTNKEIFKLSQELLIKTAIENHIKKLMVSFVSESYFCTIKAT